tara:strand:+ start:584 stop:877 length:294 start_codon:yes stop_codon:yes gene_type:complete
MRITEKKSLKKEISRQNIKDKSNILKNSSFEEFKPCKKRKSELINNEKSKITKTELKNMVGKVENIKNQLESKKSSPDKKLSFVQQQIKIINDKSKS